MTILESAINIEIRCPSEDMLFFEHIFSKRHKECNWWVNRRVDKGFKCSIEVLYSPHVDASIYDEIRTFAAVPITFYGSMNDGNTLKAFAAHNKILVFQSIDGRGNAILPKSSEHVLNKSMDYALVFYRTLQAVCFEFNKDIHGKAKRLAKIAGQKDHESMLKSYHDFKIRNSGEKNR